MAKERFVSKNFSGDTASIIRQAEEICDSYAAQGYRLSLRQLYYQFVSRDIIPNTEQSYKRIGSIISDARLAGLIDWNMIEDRGRETTANPHWDDASDFLTSVANQFHIDTWEGQANHCEVMVEKQALEGVLEPVCRSLDISFTANKGYSSSSALYEMGRRLQHIFTGGEYHPTDIMDELASGSVSYEYEKYCDYYKLPGGDFEDCLGKDGYLDNEKVYEKARNCLQPGDTGKFIHILYLGDHDPSGMDMTRDVLTRLQLFARVPIHMQRIALNMDQIRQYNPPENPAKVTDSRAPGYIAKYGNSSWELDALAPSVLANLVTRRVQELRDIELHVANVKAQTEGREALAAMASDYKRRSEDGSFTDATEGE